MSEWVTFISNVGFPVFVALIMIYFNIKQLESLEQTIHENTITINNLISALNDKGK